MIIPNIAPLGQMPTTISAKILSNIQQYTTHGLYDLLQSFKAVMDSAAEAVVGLTTPNDTDYQLLPENSIVGNNLLWDTDIINN